MGDGDFRQFEADPAVSPSPATRINLLTGNPDDLRFSGPAWKIRLLTPWPVLRLGYPDWLKGFGDFTYLDLFPLSYPDRFRRFGLFTFPDCFSLLSGLTQKVRFVIICGLFHSINRTDSGFLFTFRDSLLPS